MVNASDIVAKVTRSFAPRQEYKPIQMEEEGAQSRVSLSPLNRYKDTDNKNPDDEATIGLLEDEYPETEKLSLGQGKRRCGLNWRTWFIILGVVSFAVLVFLAAWNFRKSTADKIKGLPEFSTALGCLAAPHFYNNTRTHVVDAHMQPEKFDHGLDIRGDSVASITLASASEDSSFIHYEISISSTDADLVQRSKIVLPNPPQGNAGGGMYSSVTKVLTPYFKEQHPEACIRVDVKVYVPPSLKKLHLASHVTAHIKYAEGADVKLQNLYMTLFSLDTNNMIQTSKDVRSKHVSLEVTQGWIVGDIAVVDDATVMTQRGDGTTHVHVYPEPPRSKEAPETVTFQTTTGAGKTEVFFHKNKDTKRPIKSSHVSSRNGPVALNYEDAEFNGLVNLVAGESKTVGLEKLDNLGQNEEWTHFAGNKDGEDRISTNSRGWVSLIL